MRFIQNLPEDEKLTLSECQKKHKKSHVRNRSHAILLSAEGKSAVVIAELFKVRTRTIYEWLNRWEANGIMGLMLKPGRGSKAKLTNIDALQQKDIVTQVKLNPQKLSEVAETLSSTLPFRITKDMLKRYLKKS